jgi:RHS repeat-associated protein
MFRKLATAAALATVLISCAVSAQTVGTGAYPFASFDTPGFDSVNLGNLNTRFSIPIVQKAGRGSLPFSYALQYEGLVWTPVVGTSTTTWVPNPNWGFTGVLNGSAFAGYLTHSSFTITCNGTPSGPPHDPLVSDSLGMQIINDGYVFHDAFGANHAFSAELFGPCSAGGGTAGTSGFTTATDGSGYTLVVPTQGAGVGSATQVESRNGIIFTPGSSSTTTSATSETDTNGNEISWGGTSEVFTDTLGTTALTISGSSPVTFTYPVANQSGGATTASATLSYKAYTVQTNFGCSGIVEFGSTSVNLVDHITLADNSEYIFTYESTPGATNGAVTGRLASITLPTGGMISYTYSGGCSSAGGIMADGTTAGLSRTTADSSNARTYVRATVNANATSTTLTDQKGNQSVFQFTDDTGDYYETHRQMYQGSATGTPLLDRFTCYNGASTPCDGATLTTQITATSVTEDYNGGSQAVTNNSYDSFGNIGITTQNSGSTLLDTTANTYNSLNEIATTTIADSSGNFVSGTAYAYDKTTPTTTSDLPQHVAATGPRGNLTSTSTTINGGSSAFSTTTAYYDTGMPVSTTTPNGTTSYSYDSTQTFVTQTTLPTPSSGVALSTSWTYDAASGAMLTSTGMNAGQTTTMNTYDNRLRPTAITLPNGGNITYTYTPTQTNVTQTLNSSTGETAQQAVLYDAYGRPSRQEVYNGQSTNSYYQTDICYDATGLAEFVSVPYQSTGFSAAKQCSGTGTSYFYDALGRPTSIITSDGTATVQHVNRAVLTTDVNGVQKITQYDVLGRITGVCEITSTALNGQSPTACGMDIVGTGFVTSYAYALATHTTTITQGVQTRTFVTDDMGRTTSVTEPESGTTNYSYAYNSTGLVVTRTRPTANQTSPTTLTTTTTQSDSLGRVTSVTYSDGTPLRTYFYDINQPGFVQTNYLGRLSYANANTPNNFALTAYSYDTLGRVIGLTECLPVGCGTFADNLSLSYQYDLAGNMLSSSDGGGTTTTYTYSPASEVQSVTSSLSGSEAPPALISNVTNGPNGPLNYQFGNGLTNVSTYDALGRVNGGSVCNGSTSISCSGGSQLYGYSVQQQGIRTTTGCDTVLNNCAAFGYDQFNRLTSRTVTGSSAPQNYTYGYDRYGNRLSQTAADGGPSPQLTISATTNQITSTGYSYDAAGNVTSDGFHTYTYDAEGNVTAVDGGTTASYVYNALNQRVSENLGGLKEQFAYNVGGQRVSIWNAASPIALLMEQYYVGNKRVAYYAGSTLNFQHQDWTGTERMRTTYNGAVEGSFTSMSFGDAFATVSGIDGDPYHYAMLDHDNSSDTDHAQFRQYSSTPGRWMSPDPYSGSYNMRNPQSFNRYSYVLNNPLAGVDPSGLDCDLAVSRGGVSAKDDDGVCDCDGDCGGGGGGGGGDPISVAPGGPTAPGCNSPTCTTVPPGPPDPSPGPDPIYGPGSLPAPPGGGGGAPSNAPCPVSASSLNTYLTSKNSPMAGQGTNLMNSGIQYNIDPRLFVALAGAETGFGNNITAGQFNAFNVLYNGLNSPFNSFQSAINSVGHSLANPRNGYNFTNTTTLYGHYCSGAGCSAGLNNVNTFMNQQGANTSALHFPC